MSHAPAACIRALVSASLLLAALATGEPLPFPPGTRFEDSNIGRRTKAATVRRTGAATGGWTKAATGSWTKDGVATGTERV